MLRDARNLEKTMTKLSKTKCDQEFLQLCLIHNRPLKFTRFKLWHKKYTKHQVYYQQQRKYLQTEYNKKSKQNVKLKSDLNTLLELIKKKINPIGFQLLNKHLDR